MDEMYGDLGYGANEPAKNKKFFPWHKPRKQFVRETQWISQIQKLVDDAGCFGDERLSYLGLPGDDLIDIRAIYHDVCEKKNIPLRFLGFNKSLSSEGDSSVEVNISIDELSKLDLVCPKSEVIGDDFKKIGDPSEMAHKKVRDLGTFDVVNIDLCDGFAIDTPGEFSGSYYNAIWSLASLQSKHRRPWLLFLTTRVTPCDIHDEVYKLLTEIFGNMFVQCEPFKKVVKEKFNIQVEDALDKEKQSNLSVLRVFLTALCQWFLKSSSDFNPPVKVELKSVQGYKTYPKAEAQELVSIALRFTPQNLGTPDSIGLAGVKSPSCIDQCSESARFVDRIAALVDVDKVLLENPGVRDKMVEKTLDLLEQARFDRGKAKQWIDDGCPAL
jgi:hypothetical protein